MHTRVHTYIHTYIHTYRCTNICTNIQINNYALFSVPLPPLSSTGSIPHWVIDTDDAVPEIEQEEEDCFTRDANDTVHEIEQED